MNKPFKHSYKTKRIAQVILFGILCMISIAIMIIVLWINISKWLD